MAAAGGAQIRMTSNSTALVARVAAMRARPSTMLARGLNRSSPAISTASGASDSASTQPIEAGWMARPVSRASRMLAWSSTPDITSVSLVSGVG